MKVNFKARPRVEMINENIPILVIDDFYEDPLEVRKQALKGYFERSEAGYPGRHEPLDINNDDVLLSMTFLREVIRIASDSDFPMEMVSTDFSLLTTPSTSVLKNQSHPHTDGVALAGIVYLNETSMGGTCFYENTILNSCVLNSENEADYDRLRENQNLKETSGYVSGDFDMWKLVHKTEGKFNQLVMYVGNIFHSVSVTSEPDPTNLNTARLTQRIFVETVVPVMGEER